MIIIQYFDLSKCRTLDCKGLFLIEDLNTSTNVAGKYETRKTLCIWTYFLKSEI